MTLPGVLAVDSTAVDPFGLWQPPSAAAGDGLSFAAPGENAPGDASGAGPGDAPAAVWTLALTSGPDGPPLAEQELQRLAGQVQAIQAGLDAAGPRVDALLDARSRESSQVSFDLGEALAPRALPPPEAGLAHALNLLEPARAGDEVSFGLGGQIAGVDWAELHKRLSVLLDSVNRQILHFAWVDTTLDGRLVARTTVNWGGDFMSFWQTGLRPEPTAAHCRSLELALEARLANLRAVLTVTQIAGKIALAVATPLGPLQAMSLAWQFVNTLIRQ